MHRWSWLFASLAAVARALHEADAGVLDWYAPHVGIPLVQPASATPAFDARLSQHSTDVLLITATESNVLAALHAPNGSIAWRHIFEPEDNVISWKSGGNTIAALSGPGGATLRVFERDSGALLAETRLHKPTDGLLQQPEDFGSAIVTIPSEDGYYLLTSAHTVRRVDRAGSVKWTWTSPDQTSLVVYSRIIATPTALYALGLASSFASYTLHITALDPASGAPLASSNVDSSIISSGPTDILTLSSASTSIVAWLQDGGVRVLALEPELKAKPNKLPGAAFTRITNVGLDEAFVGVKQDGAGVVVSLDENGGGARMYTFPESATSNKHTEAFYVGARDGAGKPYVARVFWSHALRSGAVHVFAPHLADGQGLLSGFTFPFDTGVNGIIVHAAVHIAYVKPTDLLPYVVLTTSTGGVQLWQGDRQLWHREEGLSRVVVAEAVELPEREAVEHADVVGEAFVRRLQRQIRDAQHLPQYIIRFITRLTSPSSSSFSPITSTPASSSPLFRDAFGLRKLFVVATDRGKLYALDSATGTVVWSRVLGLGWAGELDGGAGAELVPARVFVVRNVTESSTGTKEGAREAVLVAQRRAGNGLVDTVIFHVDALTGRDLLGGAADGDVLEGADVISGGAIATHFVEDDGSGQNFVLLLDEFRQAYVYPDTAATNTALNALLPRLHIPLRAGAQLTSHVLQPGLGLNERALAQPTWTSSLGPDEELVALVRRPAHDVVASPGKVLGNRTTLYKYMNPHLLALISSSPDACVVRVIDGAKGSVVYHALLPRAEGDGCADVRASFVENWLVYVYWDPEWQWTGQAKGRRAVSVELYEGAPDEKTSSEGLSSFAREAAQATVYERAFVFPAGVRAMTTTRTTFGVTVKDLIVATERGQIFTLPRRLLDPRRPKGKPTAEQQEEMLIPYDPVLPDDPRRVISHRYHVANVRGLLTSPARLESTSLVFAYGLDLFGTRVAPSKTFDVLGASFNKAQLVLTTGALAAAIAIARPAVRRKRLREKWYTTRT